MLNQVVLVGRLTQTPAVEETPNGKSRSTVTVAVQRNYKNSDGVYETDFIRCVLWNSLASNTQKYCHSGDIVGIKGRLQSRTYEGEDQKTKYVTEVVAERISFLSSNKKDEETEIVDCY